MNKEKRMELVEAMKVTASALADDDLYEFLTEDILEDLDVTNDYDFAWAMHTWSKVISTDRAWKAGMWYDGVASHDLRQPDLIPTRYRHELKISESFKVPHRMVDGEVTKWRQIIIGWYDRKPILVNGSLIYKTERELTREDFAGRRDFMADYLPELDSRTIATMLISMLDADGIDGISPEEAEGLKAGWSETYKL